MVLVLVLLMTSGCKNDYEKFAEASNKHMKAESERIQTQSTEIRKLASQTPAQTEPEATLLGVIAMMQIRSLEPIPFTLKAPTTLNDVANNAVGHIPFVATVGGMYKLGKVGIESAGNINFAENATLNDSLNRTEIHATGEGNSIQYTGTKPAQVVDPVVVGVE